MIPSAPDEQEIGIECFLTDTPGIGGKLRTVPEDFSVEEIPVRPAYVEGGEYTIARVISNNWESNRLIRALAKELAMSDRDIGFAGTKDKRSVAIRHMSFRAPREKVVYIDLPGIEITKTYTSDKPLKIGKLVGNIFDIVVRGTETTGKQLIESVEEISQTIEDTGGFPNYFGVQRFGAFRPITHTIGRLFLQRKFKEAVFAYLTDPAKVEHSAAAEARARLRKETDFGQALEYYPSSLTFERYMLSHLANRPEDYIGAIRRLPRNLVMMFTNAYQSLLFNRVLSRRLKAGYSLLQPEIGDVVIATKHDGVPNLQRAIPVTVDNIEKVARKCKKAKAYVSGPIFGRDSVFAQGEIGEIEHKIIEEAGANLDDFIVPELREASSKGARRNVLALVNDMDVNPLDNLVNFNFWLYRGTYATSFLREYMKADVMSY